MTPKEIVDTLLRFAEIILSWPVMVLALFILFRRPIAAFLPELSKRLTKAEFGEAKFEFTEIKTVDTPVGKANVSAVRARASHTPFDGFYCTYLSRPHSFQVSWPSHSWSASVEKGRAFHQQSGFPPTLTIPLFIERDEAVGEFRPNVNVILESIGALSITEYMAQSRQAMQQMGWIVLSSSVDETTQGGVLVYLNTSFGTKLYQFARIILSAGVAYVVTASQLPPDDLLGQQLREELVNILNSFQVVV
ncbi:MAG: hypothetical protein AB1791_16535 [Chloroflexota bacterium]